MGNIIIRIISLSMFLYSGERFRNHLIRCGVAASLSLLKKGVRGNVCLSLRGDLPCEELHGRTTKQSRHLCCFMNRKRLLRCARNDIGVPTDHPVKLYYDNGIIAVMSEGRLHFWITTRGLDLPNIFNVNQGDYLLDALIPA